MVVIGIIILLIGVNASNSLARDVNVKIILSVAIDRDTLYVGGNGPNNYTKIQDAIDDSVDGDTVFVYSGMYYERIVVNKSINLIGEDKNTTIIDGSRHTKVVNVSANWVSISGFTIQNGSQFTLFLADFSSHNTISKNIIINVNDIPMIHIGIALWNENNHNIISDNVISKFYADGIYISNSCNNIISENSITECDTGIDLSLSSENNMIIGNDIHENDDMGIELGGIHNVISGNNIVNYLDYGISIIGAFNEIYRNTIANTTYGIHMYSHAHNNRVFENMITFNNYGVYIIGETSDNLVYHNNFFNSNQQNAYDSSSNDWDAGYPSGGNFWDDYNGTDDNDDGIGDIVYNISGDNNRDRYPFINPDGWLNYGSWWNDDWQYKKTLGITNASAEYQMPITVYKEDGYDNVKDGIIDCEDHCNADFSDIRFVAANQSALLPYWIEETGSISGDHYARIWIKTNGNDLIYMYYRNPSATDISNGTNTFHYFDHWTTNNTKEWTYDIPTVDHHHWWENTKSFTTYRALISNSMMKSWNAGIEDWAILGWSQDTSSDWRDVDHIVVQWSMKESDGATDTIVPVRLHVRNGTTSSYTTWKTVIKPDSNHKLSLSLRYCSDNISYEWKDLDGGTILAYDSISDPSVVPSPSDVPYLLHGELDVGGGIWSFLSPTYLKWGNQPINGGCKWYTDYWFIRNYTSPESEWDVFGMEQELKTIVYVDDDFTPSTPGWGYDHFDNIKDGIDCVVEGGTVFVYNGIYYGHVVVDKQVDLVGEDRNTTFIDGDNANTVVSITSEQVNIRGFTIKNGDHNGIEISPDSNGSTVVDCLVTDTYGAIFSDASHVLIDSCMISGNNEGILIRNSSYCEISNCKLSDNKRSIAIQQKSHDNVVRNCETSDGWIGIDIYSYGYNLVSGCTISNGMQLRNTSDNVIENCRISGHYDRGIVFSDCYNNVVLNSTISNNAYGTEDEFAIEIFPDSYNNLIKNCNISNNAHGGVLFLFRSYNNKIVSSTISNNGGYGVLCGIESSSNHIYTNNFINNANHAYDNTLDNYWNNETFGNYWSGYYVDDCDGDGIFDEPKDIEGEGNQDHYPLVHPYGLEPSIIITAPLENNIYFRNFKLTPFVTTLLLGNIKIKANAANYIYGIEKVEFYIDGIQRSTDTIPPYEWRWRVSSHVKHRHVLKVVAYDNTGKTVDEEIDVWRFF